MTDLSTQFLGDMAGGVLGNASVAANLMGQALPTSLVYFTSDRAESQEIARLRQLSGELAVSIQKAQGAKPNSKKYSYSGITSLINQKNQVDAKLATLGAPIDYQTARLMPANTWTDKQIKEFVNKGIAYKLDGFQPGMGMPEIQMAWDRILQQSILLSAGQDPAKGGKVWTPDMIMESYGKPGKFGTTVINGWEYDVGTGERIGYKGPLTKTTTQKNLDLSSTEDVQVIATQALRQALGREPNAQELAQFKATLHGLERSNPEVTTTTTTYKPNLETGELEAVNSDTQSSGGVSEAAKAQAITEAVKGKPEYAKNQSGTTYFNTLMGMVGGM